MPKPRFQQLEFHTIFERTIRDHVRALTSWAGSLFAFSMIITAFYPTIRGNSQLAKLYETYPKALRSFLGIADMTTGVGFLRAEVFSLVAPMLVVILGILWGSDLIAGEEDRGTIDLLLANPVTRRRVLLEKWAALGCGLIIALLGLGVGLAVGIPVFNLHVGWTAITAACVSIGLLGFLFGSLALALGAATGGRGLARGITSLLAVAAYLVSSLADLVSWLRPIREASPWYHALGVDPLTSGFQIDHLLIIIGINGIVIVAAVMAFDRRDVGV